MCLRMTVTNQNCFRELKAVYTEWMRANIRSRIFRLSVCCYLRLERLKFTELYFICAWTLVEERRLRVFLSRLLRKIWAEEGDRNRGRRCKFYDLYSLPNIIQVISSTGMRRTGYVAGTYTALMAKHGGNSRLEDLCVNGRMILKCVLKEKSCIP
jgi:hypothetical protein